MRRKGIGLGKDSKVKGSKKGGDGEALLDEDSMRRKGVYERRECEDSERSVRRNGVRGGRECEEEGSV